MTTIRIGAGILTDNEPTKAITMCLRLKTENTPHMIAEKDITCYKIVRRKPLVPDTFYGLIYHHHPYKLNEQNRKVTVEPIKGMIREGYHSFIEYSNRWICGLVGIGTDEQVSVKCTIPKGTRYYAGLDSDNRPAYVSERIVVNEVLRIKESCNDY